MRQLSGWMGSTWRQAGSRWEAHFRPWCKYASAQDRQSREIGPYWELLIVWAILIRCLVFSCAAQGQDHGALFPPGLDHEHGDAVSLRMPLSQTLRRRWIPPIPPQNASFVAGVLSKSPISSFGPGVNVRSAPGRRKGLAPTPPLGLGPSMVARLLLTPSPLIGWPRGGETPLAGSAATPALGPETPLDRRTI
jgi:hypothetical protein